jgi:hypothetical protein
MANGFHRRCIWRTEGPDIAHGRLTKEAAVFTVELAHTFVSDLEGRGCRIDPIDYHPAPRCLQPQLLLILKRAHIRQYTKMVMQRGHTHPCHLVYAYRLDSWVEVWRKKVAKGDVIVVRYAERFLQYFQDRLAKLGLELHSDKTRLIEFGRFAARNRKQRGEGTPETFTFLGFTHFCGQLTTGTFTVWRITAQKRMVAKLKAIKAELQRRKHHRTSEVGAWLRQVVLGYY